MTSPVKSSTLQSQLGFLDACGLPKKQAFLYALLLQDGEATVATLEKKSGFGKNTYALVLALEEKKLVVRYKREGRWWCQPTSPENIRRIVNKHIKLTKQVEATFDRLLPFLREEYKRNVNKPIVRYFQGKEGVKEVFADMYSPKKKQVIGCVGLVETDKELFTHVIEQLMPLRIKNNISTITINSDSLVAQKLKAKEKNTLSEIFLSDLDKYPLPAEVGIYDDKVALLSFRKNDFMGVLIENKDFATTLRSIFTMLYDCLRHEGSSKNLSNSEKD